MTAATHHISLGFTRKKYPAGAHLCLIYDSEGEKQEVISEFLAAGVDAHEKTAYFTDAWPLDAARAWLAQRSLPPDGEATYSLTYAEDVYCPNGVFDPDAMFEVWKRYYEQAVHGGYSAARATGETSWSLREIPGAGRLIEYEARLTDVLRDYPVTAVCLYDANAFDGATILDVLRVHPLMIVHGQVVQNPYYVKPQQFLEDWQAR